jgi:VCBS repeat-containing protein
VLANDSDEEGALIVRGFSSVASTTYHPNTGDITSMTEQVIGNQLWSSAGSADAGQSITTQFGTMTINSDGSFSYAVNEEYVERLSAECIVYDEFIYEAMDSNGNITTESIIVEIRGVNDAVIVTNDTIETTENSQTTGNVLNNDLEMDIDGKMIPMKVTGVSPGEIDEANMPIDNVGIEVEGQYGTLSIEENGDYTYTPFPEIANQLLEGDQLTEVFNYVVSDEYSSSQGEITITINGMGINTPPETSSTTTTSQASSTETAASSAKPEPAESNASPEPTESNASPEPAESNASPEPRESNATPEPAESNASPEPAESNASPEPAESNASPEPAESNASPESAEPSGTTESGEEAQPAEAEAPVEESATENETTAEETTAEETTAEETTAEETTAEETTAEETTAEETTAEETTEEETTAEETTAEETTEEETTAEETTEEETTEEETTAEETTEEELISEDGAESEESESTDEESVTVDDDGNVIVDTGTIQVADVDMQEDGSISVTVMDDNAAQVEEYAIADTGEGIPDWVSINPVTGEITVNPPPGQTEITLTIQTVDTNGGTRTVTMTLDIVNGTFTTSGSSDASNNSPDANIGSSNPEATAIELNEEDGGLGMNNSTTIPFSDQLNQEIFDYEKQDIA